MRANELKRLRQSLAPPEDQQALLAAAFASPEAFGDAYARWRATIGERPSEMSASLLPLLVPRLEGPAPDSVLDYCRQGYRLAWAKSAMMKRRLPELLAPFVRAGVEPILFKGLALQAHYRGGRLRAFGDLDLLIAPDRVGDAIRALLEEGWHSPAFSNPSGFDPRFAHAIEWHNASGDIIDLHVHPMHHWITWKSAGAIFRRAPVSLTIGDSEVMTFTREHHLLQTIGNALASAEPHGRWMADAIALIEGGPMDWDTLVADAERMRIAPLVGVALELVAELVPAVPFDARRRLTGSDVDPELFAFDRGLYDKSWRARLNGHWRTLRVGAGGSLPDAIRLLPDYARFCRSRRGVLTG